MLDIATSGKKQQEPVYKDGWGWKTDVAGHWHGTTVSGGVLSVYNYEK